MRSLRTPIAALAATVTLALAGAAALATASTPSLSQLNTQLGQEQARQQGLAGSIAGLNQSVASLSAQIALVQSREAQVREDLARGEQALAATRVDLVNERRLLVLLKARLARARMVLARQLVSSYEGDDPTLVDVVLRAHGFSDLLDRLTYLRDAELEQQRIITVTRRAKATADAAARRLAALEATQRAIVRGTILRERALQGMNALLGSKQAALQQAQAAQEAALQASQARASGLRSEISRIQAQEAAARAAAAAAAARRAASSAATNAPAPVATGPALGASGGWVIPSSIVQCESGGQNLPPNSAGASGYYQIMPGTWQMFGGSGPAAYLAPKSEQDAVAQRIWGGGGGASNWVCAGMVGIH